MIRRTAVPPEVLRRAGSGRRTRVVRATKLRRGVYRLELRGDRPSSLVAKRLRPGDGELERLLTDRWLPSVGLGDCGPPRTAVVVESSGAHVWHLYEDLGPWGLDGPVDPPRVEAAMGVLADVHARFRDSELLPEIRFECGDLGTHFYVHSIRDAIRILEALQRRAAQLSDQLGAIERLLDTLHRLVDEERFRVSVLATAGPETFLHGDLTRANVFVVPGEAGATVRLIDWTHASVGPAAFDITTHLEHFPPEDRSWVLDCYVDAMGSRGQSFTAETDWNLLFDTLAAGRLANTVIWPAVEALHGGEWAFAELACREHELCDRAPLLSSIPVHNTGEADR